MQRFSFVLCLVILVATATCSLAGEKKMTPDTIEGVKIVDADQVKAWLDAGEDMLIVDARKTSDYEAGHLPGAESYLIPLDLDISDEAVAKSVAALEAYEDLAGYPKDILLVTYCNGDT